MLKGIIEKVVVLEGGRGVKCVVKREEREGRAAMLMLNAKRCTCRRPILDITAE